MTGTEQGGFDWAWLLNNLEIEKLTIGADGTNKAKDYVEIPGFVMGYKGLSAAEGYLLGRFHLYTQVYLHKTTRAAEKMLGALIDRVAELAISSSSERTGLPTNHPILSFFSADGATLKNYLRLDDSLVWGAIPLMDQAADSVVRELAGRLQRRRLYKCIDIGGLAFGKRGDAVARFHKQLNEIKKNGGFSDLDVFFDREKVSAYTYREYESKDALQKIVIRRPGTAQSYDDIANISNVVKAIGIHDVFRVYTRNDEIKERVTVIWQEASK